MFIILSCSQCALILVLEYMGNSGIRLPPGCRSCGVRVPCLCGIRMLSLYATGWPVFPKCMQLTLVSWYVASMLCCHCGPFVSVAVQISARHKVLVSYRSIFLHEIGGISRLTLWRRWLHSCRMLLLLVEYGLVHRADCINCETCQFCFDPAFVWPCVGRADFHSA